MTNDSEQKITNNTAEAAISALFSGDNVFVIPYFQRAYKWTDSKITRFKEDLEKLLDIDGTNHFLGAIIIYGKKKNPSDPNYYEVIDGQQRLTTCYLALAALCYTFSKHGLNDTALTIYQQFLVLLRQIKENQITNAKLLCCKEDRAGMNAVFKELYSNGDFFLLVKNANCVYRKMQTSGEEKEGRTLTNFRTFCHFFEKYYSEYEKQNVGDGEIILNKFYDKLVFCLRIVQIVVNDPTDGPKIFNSLNSKQEPITIGDLVRNEIFSRLSGQDDEIEYLDKQIWHPFYEKFKQKDNEYWDKVFEQYFFPFVLTIDQKVKKGDAFNYLRERWARMNPESIIKELSKYQTIYLDLWYGTHLFDCSPVISEDINRLSRLGAPTTVYPFLFHVIHGISEGVISESIADSVLKKIESFLIRRMVCGYEPTGLHAAFKALWDECDSDYSIENVVKCLKNHSTVSWPDDNQFETAIKSRPLYKVKATPYILSEWNRKLGGDIVILTSSQQVEHVLPEHPDKDSRWFKDWTKEEFEAKKDCLANLLPLSSKLNASIGNEEYSDKKERYLMDSALKASRVFAKEHAVWTPEEFDKRKEKLWDWAVARWPY